MTTTTRTRGRADNDDDGGDDDEESGMATQMEKDIRREIHIEREVCTSVLEEFKRNHTKQKNFNPQSLRGTDSEIPPQAVAVFDEWLMSRNPRSSLP